MARGAVQHIAAGLAGVSEVARYQARVVCDAIHVSGAQPLACGDAEGAAVALQRFGAEVAAQPFRVRGGKGDGAGGSECRGAIDNAIEDGGALEQLQRFQCRIHRGPR